MVLETGEKQSCLPDFHCLRFVKKIYGGNLCSMVKKLFHFSYTAQMKQFMVISISIFSSLEIVNSSLVYSHFSPADSIELALSDPRSISQGTLFY